MEDLHDDIHQNTTEFNLNKKEGYKPKSWEEELNLNPYLSQSDWKIPKKMGLKPEVISNAEESEKNHYEENNALFLPNPLDSTHLSAEFLSTLKSSNENLNRFEEKLNILLESSQDMSHNTQQDSSKKDFSDLMSLLKQINEKYESVNFVDTLQPITQAIQEMNQKMVWLSERIEENQKAIQNPHNQRVDRLEKKIDLLINSLANTQKDFDTLEKTNREIQQNQGFLTQIEQKIENFSEIPKQEAMLETQEQLSKGIEHLRILLEHLDQQVSTAPEKEILPDILKSIRHNSDYLHGVKNHLEHFIEARNHTSPDAVLEGMYANNLHLAKVEQKMDLLIQYMERLVLTLNKS